MTEQNTLIPVDFDDLDDWLLSLGSDFSASELHGALVGALSGAMRLSGAEWSAFALAVMGGDDRLQYDKDCRNTLAGFAHEQLELLTSDDMDFRVFLPDDEEDIAARVESLSLWCKGFLGGFAEAQVHQARREGNEEGITPDAFPDNVAEVLHDMSAIAQVAIARAEGDYDEDDFDENDFDENDIESFDDDLGIDDVVQSMAGEEYDERDYMELVEYLKLGALTVFTEFGWVEVLSEEDDFPKQRRADSLQSAIELENSKNRTLH